MSSVDCKNYRALTFLVLISFSLISIPFVGSAADGYNPIEEHWVESGLVHIEHTTNETHSGVAIDDYLSSLDSIYDNPSLAVDESGKLFKLSLN